MCVSVRRAYNILSAESPPIARLPRLQSLDPMPIAQDTRPDLRPKMLIAYAHGVVQLMRNENDMSPIVARFPQLTATCARWCPNGSFFAYVDIEPQSVSLNNCTAVVAGGDSYFIWRFVTPHKNSITSRNVGSVTEDRSLLAEVALLRLDIPTAEYAYAVSLSRTHKLQDVNVLMDNLMHSQLRFCVFQTSGALVNSADPL
ncbi:hypothetical protein Q1695_000015 [Nippostrongylus brasiliensis]|nr:hypothetical protein Q1695_000015 [Nippostrongylus brasiliensis]